MKKPLAIFIAIILFLGVGVGAFFVTKILDEKNTLSSTPDADFLVSGGRWIKSDTDGKVVWQFSSDGTCKITTNNDEYFDCAWYLDGETLGIKTSWLIDLEDEFKISFDKGNNSFTVTSNSDKEVSKFLKDVNIE